MLDKLCWLFTCCHGNKKDSRPMPPLLQRFDTDDSDSFTYSQYYHSRGRSRSRPTPINTNVPRVPENSPT